jgi:hypothetical protein
MTGAARGGTAPSEGWEGDLKVTSLTAATGERSRLVRGLYLTALAVFLVTVAIGILNGLDLVEFDRNQLLTHVHSGTLGWITLGIVASATWLLRSADRRLAWALAVVVPIYVAAFYLGNPAARAVTGAALLVLIVWVLVWAWRAALEVRSLPVVAVALGLTTFTYGAVIGVLIQLQTATGSTIFNGDAIGAHASTMVFSYLVLVAMGLIEWRTMGTTDLPRGGLAQLLLLFGGGLLLAVTLLFLPESAVQAVGGVYLLVELCAVVLFVRRVLRRAMAADWTSPTPARFVAASAAFVVVAMAIFLILIAMFIASGDPTAIPLGILVASDHAVFVGVMTNLLFGLALTASADQRDRWPWADQLVFWGMNLGLAVFLIGLIADAAIVKRVGSPVMGVAIVLGIATLVVRLRSSDLRAIDQS